MCAHPSLLRVARLYALVDHRLFYRFIHLWVWAGWWRLAGFGNGAGGRGRARSGDRGFFG